MASHSDDTFVLKLFSLAVYTYSSERDQITCPKIKLFPVSSNQNKKHNIEHS